MRDCWASAVGDCAGGNSGEHVLSACPFEYPEVLVGGRPRYAEGEKQNPLKRLVGNGGLSEVLRFQWDADTEPMRPPLDRNE